VCRKQNGLALVLEKTGQAFQEIAPEDRIQTRGRLVQNEKIGVVGEGQGQAEFHFHAARKPGEFLARGQVEFR
jgi:hypothetical protein